MKRAGLWALPIVFVVFTAAVLTAQVITAPPLSGNFVLSVSGFELVTALAPPGSPSIHLDIRGEGLVTADGNGNLAGTETFTATNPGVPENGTVAATCAGTLAGTVAEPGDGSAQVQLQFTPNTMPSGGTGAQEACVPAAISLSCSEIFSNSFVLPFAAVGAVPTPAPTPAPPSKKRRKHRHHASVIPVDGFFGSSANQLKCVATSVVTSSSAVSIDGASLGMDMRETAPASITIPTPIPCATPLTNCDGECTDLTSDPNNCGSCDNSCQPGQQCQSSVCVGAPVCGDPTQTLCNGMCTDITSDSNNCGACGVVCGNGTQCEYGACVPPDQAGQRRRR